MNKKSVIIIVVLAVIIMAIAMLPLTMNSGKTNEECHDECCNPKGEHEYKICEELIVACPDCNGKFSESEPCETCENTGTVVLYGPFLCDKNGEVVTDCVE